MSARVGTLKLVRANKAGSGKVVSRIPIFADDANTVPGLIVNTTLGDPATGAGLHAGKAFNKQSDIPADADFDWATEEARTN